MAENKDLFIIHFPALRKWLTSWITNQGLVVRSSAHPVFQMGEFTEVASPFVVNGIFNTPSLCLKIKVFFRGNLDGNL